MINKIKTRTSLRSDSNNSKFIVETVYVIEEIRFIFIQAQLFQDLK